VRSIALERRLIAVQADLTPERRLVSTGGQARSLYAELMRNLSTRSKPEGGALPAVIERFVATVLTEAREKRRDPEAVFGERAAALSEMVGGYDFAQVVACYWRGHENGSEELKQAAVRWLRGEFTTRTDARQALGVRTIIDDASVYDHLKLLARFARLAGYGGLLVCLDELVNLHRMANGRARNANYEQILRILNDCLQGTADGLGFLLSGTPEFVTDTRRGLFSYQALQTRLAENTFARGGLVDHSGPLIRLASLSAEDIFVLLAKLRHVYAGGAEERYLLPDEALYAFMEHCSKRIGNAYFRTPRNTIREFIHLLAVLEQNPGTAWGNLIEQVVVEGEPDPDLESLPESVAGEGSDDDLSSFRL
jgi:hypothetical protein